MKIKTHIITIALSIFTIGPLLQAQEKQPSESAVLAEELLTLLNVQKNMDAASQQLWKMTDQIAFPAGTTPEAKEELQKMQEASKTETKALVNWETLKPMFVSIYSETFTPDELKGMIAFYKTPIGQKWLEKQPQVQMATMQKIQAIMAESQPNIQKVIQRAMDAQKETK